MHKLARGSLTALTLAAAGIAIQASSHREAPGITKTPKVDGTDFYMFRSYEAGRSGYVTLLANYQPFQDPAGGPNFFMFDEDAVYEIHVDNTGDGREDMTFQFQFKNTSKDIAVLVGDRLVPVPLINVGPIGPGRDDTANLNVEETFSLSVVRGSRRTGQRQAITDAASGSATFKKPGVCCCVAVIAIKIQLLVRWKIKETRANQLRASPISSILLDQAGFLKQVLFVLGHIVHRRLGILLARDC